MRGISILLIMAAGTTSLIGCQSKPGQSGIVTPDDNVLTEATTATTSANQSGYPQIVDRTTAAPTAPKQADTDLPVIAVKPLVTAKEPEHEDIWDRMRSGFSLSHELHRKRVGNELKWFINHPEYVERVARRAAPHLHYIVGELEKRGMPREFALLPVVESAFDPFAYSHGRAAGLWQFIPSTARVYGLKIDWWYDGRRDIRASTTAALDYLEFLHQMFSGDWLLALASYNAGQGNVLSSIRASKLPRDQADFWSIKVLRETSTYVPRLLAISEIIANPDRYHMQLPPIANEAYWDVVAIDGQLDLNRAAELADITPEQLYALNPGYNQWATHPDGPHELLLPIDAIAGFKANLAALPIEDRIAWQRHKIRNGESLGSIAKKYRTTIGAIRSANHISGDIIRAGDSLLIPSAAEHERYAMTAASRLAKRQASLAKVYGAEPITYTVKSGDSLWKIARDHGVGMRELARWNGMGTTGMLKVGTDLKIFKSSHEPVLSATKPRQQVRKLNYRVRRGESLALIASKFNVSVQNIRNWNQALAMKKYIHPGDRLTLYVDVTSLIN